MNDPFANAHSKKESKHPAAELDKRERASRPSKDKQLEKGLVHISFK